MLRKGLVRSPARSPEARSVSRGIRLRAVTYSTVKERAKGLEPSTPTLARLSAHCLQLYEASAVATCSLQATFPGGSASGLSAHRRAAHISIGSSLSQKTHFNSVGPLEVGIGTIRFPQCKQRVTGSMGRTPTWVPNIGT